jgi:hypothetical protein
LGDWVYLDTPATVRVEAQPYGYFTGVNDLIQPGRRWFGVPFRQPHFLPYDTFRSSIAPGTASFAIGVPAVRLTRQ